MADRMAEYDVPAVSVAMLHDGAVVWARAWGTADVESGVPAGQGTLFQAASISKPVAALAALSLVDEGKLDLDAPVNDYLTTWKIPDNEFSADSAVTLRHLLTHSAGLTVWGFPGYRKDEDFAPGQPVATNVQVLDGEGNTDPVRLYKEPGISWQYSGGGYTVMEQLLEDIEGQSFPLIAQERVLGPAHMTLSTYEHPLPRARWQEAAHAYDAEGTLIEGGWHNYPEQAAAGLWTTPSDLAALSAHLLGILDGSVTDGIISRPLLEEMLTPNQGGAEGYQNWGLGFALSAPDDAARFGHGGSNAGFKANWQVFRDGRSGYAIMTNGDRGSALAGEIARGIARVYNLPGPHPETRTRVEVSDAVLDGIVGEYWLQGEPEFTLTAERGDDGALNLVVPGQGTMVFYPMSDDEWFDMADGGVLTFERDEDGNVTQATNEEGTTIIRK
jgi:CubicO group peptidase (beta-lactamase class C family)